MVDINTELMMAILSMDAYNQGYDTGIDGIGTHIGDASVIPLVSLNYGDSLLNTLNSGL